MAEQTLTPRPQPAVTVRGLQKRFRRGSGLDDVDNLDLDVEQGEIVALLAPPGTRSPLLRVLSGRMHPDSGHVRVLGAEPARAARWWRSSVVVMLPQRAHRLPHTPGELVREAACWHRTPWNPDALLHDVGLDAVRDVPARELSPDHQRCLDVALAVVGVPRLLLLDEPTRGLGPAATRDIHSVVRTARAAGATVLLTTSCPDEAWLLADRAVALVAGRCLALDGPGRRPEPGSSAVRLTWTCGGVTREVYGADPTRLAAELSQPPLAGTDGQLLGVTA